MPCREPCLDISLIDNENMLLSTHMEIGSLDYFSKLLEFPFGLQLK